MTKAGATLDNFLGIGTLDGTFHLASCTKIPTNQDQFKQNVISFPFEGSPRQLSERYMYVLAIEIDGVVQL
jgi:hypothetical protein